jgi:hypothetical protein
VNTGGEEVSVGVLLACIQLALLWQYRDSFKQLFARTIRPAEES